MIATGARTDAGSYASSPCQACRMSLNGPVGVLTLAGFLRRLAHLRISIGVSVAVKIKAPYVEAGFAQRIAPGISVEPMGDRKSRWERCAMDIQHGPHPHRPAFCRRQVAQEQLQSAPRTG